MSTTGYTTFTKVSLPNGWLSNFSPHPIVVDGKKWRTVEAWFQAQRFKDDAVKEMIRAEKSPFAAKLIAKARKSDFMFPQASVADIRNLYNGLVHKITEHRELLYKLMSTNDTTIIEDTTNRPGNSPWGAKLVDGRWVGDNLLGKAWMELRDTWFSSTNFHKMLPIECDNNKSVVTRNGKRVVVSYTQRKKLKNIWIDDITDPMWFELACSKIE